MLLTVFKFLHRWTINVNRICFLCDYMRYVYIILNDIDYKIYFSKYYEFQD